MNILKLLAFGWFDICCLLAVGLSHLILFVFIVCLYVTFCLVFDVVTGLISCCVVVSVGCFYFVWL